MPFKSLLRAEKSTDRGTPSIRIVTPSRIKPTVVASTSPEKRNVQMGSARRKLGCKLHKQLVESFERERLTSANLIFDYDGRNQNADALNEIADDVDQSGAHVHIARLVVRVTVLSSAVRVTVSSIAVRMTAASVRVSVMN